MGLKIVTSAEIKRINKQRQRDPRTTTFTRQKDEEELAKETEKEKPLS